MTEGTAVIGTGISKCVCFTWDASGPTFSMVGMQTTQSDAQPLGILRATRDSRHMVDETREVSEIVEEESEGIEGVYL